MIKILTDTIDSFDFIASSAFPDHVCERIQSINDIDNGDVLFSFISSSIFSEMHIAILNKNCTVFELRPIICTV